MKKRIEFFFDENSVTDAEIGTVVMLHNGVAIVLPKPHFAIECVPLPVTQTKKEKMMGIIFLPEKKYKCSKCGSFNCQPYTEPPTNKYSGHYEGVNCLKCGHQSRRYVKSIFEEESGGGKSYSISFDDIVEF